MKDVDQNRTEDGEMVEGRKEASGNRAGQTGYVATPQRRESPSRVGAACSVANLTL